MDNIKLSVTIELQGRTMLKESVAKKLNAYNTFNVTVYDRHKKSVKKEVLTVKTRKNESIKQVVNLGQSTYDYMVGKECPEWFLEIWNNGHKNNPKDWVKLNNKNRLELHLKRLCEGLNGTSYTYEVFPD